MPRRDYILSLIEQAGQFFRAISAERESGQPDMAIQTVIGSIEKLFGLTVSDLTSLDVDSLFDQLTREENAGMARDKCLVFAELNNQAGLAFAEKDLPALAQPAFHLALVFALKALTAYPRAGLPPFAPDVALLRYHLEGFDLPESTLGLLAQYERSLAPAGPTAGKG
ncbi:MAG TPA: hypothetical protein VIJ19_04850 [Opitutaceae bacterium]